MILLSSIPSPSTGVWWLGPIPIRAYGILTVCAMALAGWIAYRRYIKRGGVGDVAYDAFIWAIPLGIVGARFYHVFTHWSEYFGPGTDFWTIFKIWEGGQAIWGALALGSVGVLIALRRDRQRVGPLADSLAPGLLLAQVLGRFGNYFNQELFGGPTTLPWGLEIDAAHLPPGVPEGTLFHPTFLYEGLWNLTGALLLMWLGRKFYFYSGQIMALYLVVYGSGRFWIEQIRVDPSYDFLGIRTNAWAALLAVVAGIIIFVVCAKVGAPARVSAAERLAYFEMRAAKSGRELTEEEMRIVEGSEETEDEVPSKPE